MKGDDAVKGLLPKDVSYIQRAFIVATRWHTDVVDALVKGARETLLYYGVPEAAVREVYVPGAFELPLGVRAAIRNVENLRATRFFKDVRQYAGAAGDMMFRMEAFRAFTWGPQFPILVVALGCVIRGETPHFHYISRSVTDALLQLSIQSGVPVGYGLLTTETKEQALARASGADNKGREAALAALAMTDLLARAWRDKPPFHVTTDELDKNIQLSLPDAPPWKHPDGAAEE